MTSSIGVGQAYSSLREIYKSFREAKTALIIPRLMGKSNFIKLYSQLGVFKLLYMVDLEVLKNYCDEQLTQLIDFDKYHNGKLMETLRAVLDALIANNFMEK